MLVWLGEWLARYFHFFHVFQYITLRAILSTLTSLLIALLVGPLLIRHLQKLHFGQVVRDDGPQSHLAKEGTPTMGGALFLVAIAISTIFWGDLSNRYIWLVLIVTMGFGAIGLQDDYLKLVLKHSRGLSARRKLFYQSLLALSAALYLFTSAKLPGETTLIFPFFKNVLLPLGPFFIILTYFVIVGSSNAVNLTDGLDGLAIMPVVMVAGALGVFAYAAGNIFHATYLAIPYIPGAGELVVYCGAIVGAGLGFLWFNAYPAQVFMGDVGALALCAALGTIALIVRQEIVFFLMSGIFVLETVSVILQVASFKLTGRRIFKMSPIQDRKSTRLN